jgi:hypothetical protein
MKIKVGDNIRHYLFGGEGDSSCAHGIPDGTGHYQLHGFWPRHVLRNGSDH